MAKTTTSISIETELLEQLREELEWNDSQSEWIEEAIRMRLDQEDDADDED